MVSGRAAAKSTPDSSPVALDDAERGANKIGLDFYFAILASTTSGCLWFLAAPPYDLSLLAWVAALPVFYVVERSPTLKQAALFSWWTGTIASAGGFYWIAALLRRFADVPQPLAFLLYLLFCGYQGITFLLFGVIVYIAKRRTGTPMTLLGPVAIVTAELMVPLLFPFYLAITQAWHPSIIQIADLTGPMGVSALLIMVNGTLYDLFTLRQKGLLAAFGGAIVLVAAILYGEFRIRHFETLAATAPKLAVGIVQPNVAYNQKGTTHQDRAKAQLLALQEQSQRLEQSKAQLIVWSETSYPYYLPRDLAHDFPPRSPARIQRGFSTPVIVGALTRSPTDGWIFNSALLIDQDGRIAGGYDKTQLVAFSEHMPGIETLPWLGKIIPAGFGRIRPGTEIHTLPLTTSDGHVWRLGTLICYEDILPQLLRRIGAERPQLLVNVTNDSWFGERAEPWQHLALAVFASVEQRTSMVRAVNSGVSAFINPTGRIIAQTYAADPAEHPRPATSALTTLPLLEGGHTFFAKVGNLFAYVCSVTTVLLLIGRRGSAKR